MNAGNKKNSTTVDRKSDRELVTQRIFDGPARIVFAAWTRPELLQRWWVPKSSGMTLNCEADVRVGGQYRFEFSHPDWEQPMAFFGKYTEVTPPTRLCWTNEESGEVSFTTVTFEEKDGKTLLTHHELYPSKAALDAYFEGAVEGMDGGIPEQFEQLAELLTTIGSEV